MKTSSLEKALAASALPHTGHSFEVSMNNCSVQVYVNRVLIKEFYYKAEECISGRWWGWLNGDRIARDTGHLNRLIEQAVSAIKNAKATTILYGAPA